MTARKCNKKYYIWISPDIAWKVRGDNLDQALIKMNKIIKARFLELTKEYRTSSFNINIEERDS